MSKRIRWRLLSLICLVRGHRYQEWKVGYVCGRCHLWTTGQAVVTRG